MLVDPRVSRAKFAREVEEVCAHVRLFEARGAFVVSADFPELFILLATPNTKPSYLPVAVLVDYRDYDLRPPSLKLIHPFTREPLSQEDARNMGMLGPAVVGPGMVRAGMFTRLTSKPDGTQELSSIVQCHPGGTPFICLAGIREYHESSAHSGDSWWLHRGAAEGKLFWILENLCKYGTQPIAGVQVSLGPFALSEIPQ